MARRDEMQIRLLTLSPGKNLADQLQGSVGPPTIQKTITKLRLIFLDFFTASTSYRASES